MTRFRLETIDFGAADSPHHAAAGASVAAPTHPQSGSVERHLRAAPARKASARPRKKTDLVTATFVVSSRHRQLIRSRARSAGLYQWAWLSDVVLAGCAHMSEPIDRPRRTGPSNRPAHVHYTVSLSVEARDTLTSMAERFATGDRSLLLRHLLDQLT